MMPPSSEYRLRSLLAASVASVAMVTLAGCNATVGKGVAAIEKTSRADRTSIAGLLAYIEEIRAEGGPERDKRLASAYARLSNAYEKAGRTADSRDALAQAALLGRASAQRQILRLHSEGLYTPSPLAPFLDIYRDLALKENLVRAALFLAELAGKGVLGPDRVARQIRWNKVAAANGSRGAVNELIALYDRTGNVEEAARLLRDRFGADAPRRFFARGRDAFEGKDRPRDVSIAARWFALAYPGQRDRLQRYAVNGYREASGAARDVLRPYFIDAVADDTGRAITTAIGLIETAASGDESTAVLAALEQRAAKGGPRAISFLAGRALGPDDSVTDEAFALLRAPAEAGEERALRVLARGPLDPPTLSAENRQARDRLLRQAAENGNPSAALYTARRLSNDGTDINDEALQYFVRAAEGGEIAAARVLTNSPQAIENLAEPQRERVLALLRSAADAGSTSAAYYLGARALGERNELTPDALSLLTKAAAGGSDQAVRLLGNRATFLKPDDPAIASLLEALNEAADKGSAAASLALGQLYAVGGPVVRDPPRAFGYFKNSADQGDAEAAFRTGVAYAEGVGVERDLTAARRYLQQAADAGNASAKLYLSTLSTT